MSPYDKMDPGIRDIVRAINLLGYETTDSGDGCSKDTSDPEVLDVAHVAVRTSRRGLVSDADKLLVRMRKRPKQFPPHYRIEASYDPNDGVPLILVTWPTPLPAEPAAGQARGPR